MSYTNPSISQTLLISLVGFLVVFSVLVVLMGMIWTMGKMLGRKKSASVPDTKPIPAPVSAAPAGLILENVSEKEAAAIMAIVADELKKDPAELNFISIKEVK